jgi:hypothetical protein
LVLLVDKYANPVEAAEGRKAHNVWNGADGIASNTLETMCLMYLVPFHLFLSSHYHKPFLPNSGATNLL